MAGNNEHYYEKNAKNISKSPITKRNAIGRERVKFGGVSAVR